MRTLDLVTQILLIVGGLNWLLVGAFGFGVSGGGGRSTAASTGCRWRGSPQTEM